jgi:hypothetical protein
MLRRHRLSLRCARVVRCALHVFLRVWLASGLVPHPFSSAVHVQCRVMVFDVHVLSQAEGFCR